MRRHEPPNPPVQLVGEERCPPSPPVQLVGDERYQELPTPLLHSWS